MTGFIDAIYILHRAPGMPGRGAAVVLTREARAQQRQGINTDMGNPVAGGWFMRNMIRILWAGLALGLFIFVGTVAAEVVWTDVVTDAADDVEDDADNPISGRPEADILSVTMADEGDSINLTLELAGAYDSSGGMYTIYMEADGGDSYQFTRVMFVGFMGTGPGQSSISVDGHVSDDGKMLSWVVAKADIDATNKFEIDFASATSTTGQTALDYAGTGAGPSGDFDPSKVTMVIEFTKLHVMKMTATMLFEGQGAASLRDWLDADDDGTITADEVTDLEDMMNDDDTETEFNMTLDGKDPTSVVGEVRIEGAEGATQPTKPTTIVATQTVTFPKPDDADTHTYAWPDDDDGFLGSEGEWGDSDVTFKIVCSDGWKFKTGDWPEGLKDYLEDDGAEIEMSATAYKNNFASTIGQLDDLVVEKTDTDDSPGLGLVAVLPAVVIAALVVRKRR
jgi:hypothetical protein